jgi:uncharacterized damage-inducible protein DinB
MDYQYEQAVEILRRTPATLTAALRGLSGEWTTSTEGPDTWSAYDVVKHLLHAEVADWNWIERARTILEYGEQRPLDSVNRTAMFEKYRGLSLDQLLAAFEQSRTKNLVTLSELHITPEKLRLRGTHPALGTVTLSQLLATWVIHDLNHIGQVVEVMSRQYAEAVGPWSANLAILTRPILTEE